MYNLIYLALLFVYSYFGVLEIILYSMLAIAIISLLHATFRQKSSKAGFTIIAEDTSIYIIFL